MIYNPDGSYKHVDGNRWPAIKRNFFLTFVAIVGAVCFWLYRGYSDDKKLEIAISCLEEYCNSYKIDYYEFESFPYIFNNPANGMSTYVFNYKKDPMLELRVVVPKEPWGYPQSFLLRRVRPRKTEGAKPAFAEKR